MHPQDWNLPYGLTILALFCIVMIRSNGTYWIGRGIVAGTSHTRWRRVLETRPYRVGSSWLNCWGPPAVTLSFLVVGLQTMVNLAAGVARMPMRLYLPAVIVGCTVWAFIWGTGGMISLVLLSMAWEHSPAMTITGLTVMAAAVNRRNAATPPCPPTAPRSRRFSTRSKPAAAGWRDGNRCRPPARNGGPPVPHRAHSA